MRLNPTRNKYLAKIRRFFYYGNRSLQDYGKFLDEAKNHGFRFAPLKEFVKKREHNENIIGLRHDVDCSIDQAFKIAEIEHNANIQATYFVLHTAKYFYQDISKNILNKKLLKKLTHLQNNLGHEIGLHVDLMPIEFNHKKDPFMYLRRLLDCLKKKGINVVGVSPHGNLFHHLYRKANLVPTKDIKNDIFVNPYIEFDLKKFNLSYEAYSLDHDIYYSDASFIDQKRWDFSAIEKSFFTVSESNKRTIISTHPIHWANSKLHYFTINFILTIEYCFRYLAEYHQYRRAK
ncbi:MAG: hypothetical protein ACE5IY_11890 [bacterium]